ncbi:sigma-70 family RNA polymerase sigma factor [Mycolicibacterium sp. P9-64]|uniref:sigma-70 family RNA polymerase sigma factor n=1 Tax=Mycolicibacterium sp. P9-64 TaxID=2024612 RepID=UPI002413A7CF|nr:sigma-70 family RNA polymerase sigma factor [Mycolicibacterium sp. P9-64]
MTSTQNRMADETDGTRIEFMHRADSYRRELLVLCYRMLGSMDDAEDAVQDTYVRAWRSHEGFEYRASLRTWMYRIATRVCLKALEGRARRPLPSGLGGPAGADGVTEGALDAEPFEVAWLQPLPDSAFHDNPADVVAVREGVRLALIAALQYLPPRQRAVLILRDVLEWPTGDVAAMLGTTRAAVNSVLQRARTHLAAVSPTEDVLVEPTDPRFVVLLEQYAAAFEGAEIAILTKLLTEEAVWEMPPIATWFAGRDSVCAFLSTRLHTAGHLRLVRTAGNGQPAFGVYARGSDGVHHPHGVHVLTVTPSGIAHVVAFHDLNTFARFDLPQSLHDERKTTCSW